MANKTRNFYGVRRDYITGGSSVNVYRSLASAMREIMRDPKPTGYASAPRLTLERL